MKVLKLQGDLQGDPKLLTIDIIDFNKIVLLVDKYIDNAIKYYYVDTSKNKCVLYSMNTDSSHDGMDITYGNEDPQIRITAVLTDLLLPEGESMLYIFDDDVGFFEWYNLNSELAHEVKWLNTLYKISSQRNKK